jgi:hypothetical protein
MGRTYTSDIVIVGGGAAGIMAALSAKYHAPLKSVILLEGSFAAGRKILVSGGGRCNLYNENLITNPEDHYYDTDKKLLRSVFNQFGYNEIKRFFADLGILTYVESKQNTGKVFPITDQAHNVLELLLELLKVLDIKLHLNSKVVAIKKEDKFKIQVNKEGNSDMYIADRLILAAGGKTYPALGADGSGFDLAKALGHKIIEPVVAAVPLTSKAQIAQHLQGVKVQAGLSLFNNTKLIKQTFGDLLFTKYGVSGSAVLNISREASVLINRERLSELELSMDFVMLTQDQLNRKLLELCRKNKGINLPQSLFGLIHYKIANYICRQLKLDSRSYLELTEQERSALLESLTNYKIKINGTRGWNEAEFTSGGVDTNEIDHKSLESNLCSGVYLCGEVLNVDGEIGGYNLSWAWASGSVAGKNAALLS